MKKLVFLYTNDLHGCFEEDTNRKIIGLEQISIIKKSVQADLLFDAGDFFPSRVSSIETCQEILMSLKKSGYDYIAIGNHDLDCGCEMLYQANRIVDLKLISSNISCKQFTSWIKAEIKVIQGISVGIFGITSEEVLVHKTEMELEQIQFSNVIDTARQQVNYLKQSGAKIIIAVVHLGLLDEDVIGTESPTLANEVNGIDFIIDGHSHTVLESGHRVKDTWIVQSGSSGSYIGKLDIVVDEFDRIQQKDIKLLSYDEVKQVRVL